MKNINEMKEECRRYANVFKVFKDAEMFFQSLESSEHLEKELMSRIAALQISEGAMLEKNSKLEQVRQDAEDRAMAIVNAAENECFKMREKAMADVDAEKARVEAVQKDCDMVKQQIEVAKKNLQALDQQVAERKEELERLDAAKKNTLKAFGG